MKRKSERILSLLKKDLKNYYPLLISMFLVWLLIRLITHAFCPMIIFCGLPCPGCGLTRAGKALLRLDPVTAWERNPAIFAWAPYLLALLFQRYFREEPVRKLRPFLLLTVLITVAVYIYRMLYLFPGEPPLIYREENLLGHLYGDYDSWMKSHIPPPYR